MELQRVHAVAARVQRVQLGRVAVGLLTQCKRGGAAQLAGIVRQRRGVGPGALQAFAQRGVGGQQIVVGPVGVLVEDLMGGAGRHDGISMALA
ncbi:hypothetical protein SDC9_118559 [bioreactor metagenome]|uniref:Uncharacterized protein n=1 Tax=bioreactor metagenome TaxID=1076179 RepID=A0A645C3R8_9ZZZZ